MAEEIGKMAGGSTIGPQGVVAEEIPFMPAELSYFIKWSSFPYPEFPTKGQVFKKNPTTSMKSRTNAPTGTLMAPHARCYRTPHVG